MDEGRRMKDDLLRFHRELQRITRIIGGNVSLVDAFLRFGFGERLHIGISIHMRREHNIYRFIIR